MCAVLVLPEGVVVHFIRALTLMTTFAPACATNLGEMCWHDTPEIHTECPSRM